MLKRVNLDKVDEKVRNFLMGLKLDEDQYILEVEGKPLAGLVAPAQAEKMSRAKENLFETVNKIWERNKKVTSLSSTSSTMETSQETRETFQ